MLSHVYFTHSVIVSTDYYQHSYRQRPSGTQYRLSEPVIIQDNLSVGYFLFFECNRQIDSGDVTGKCHGEWSSIFPHQTEK